MKFKDIHFRGRIEMWIWEQIVEHAVQSLGYKLNEKSGRLIYYKNDEGVPVCIESSMCSSDSVAKIGHKQDLEQIEQDGKLKDAINDLRCLNELQGFQTDQIHFREQKDEREIYTSNYVLCRKLSRSPIFASLEFLELHQKYKDFRYKYNLTCINNQR